MPQIDWAKASASVMDWWSMAGVDVVVADHPFEWLAHPPEDAPPPVADPRPNAPASDNGAFVPVVPANMPAMPADLAAFLAWRTGPDAPEHAWGGRAVAPSGPPDAPLVVLADCPDRDDADGLLSGEAGRLFDRMLAAIGSSRDAVLLASIATVRPVASRMPREAEATLGVIARQLIALAPAPRVLTLGNAASRALLAMDLAEARGRVHSIGRKDGGTIGVVATYHPRLLRERAAYKAEAWRDLQLLLGRAK